MTPGDLIRSARKQAGMTQSELARRLSTTQPAIARLESVRSNPRVGTLRSALRELGMDLALAAEPRPVSPDDSLIAAHLALTPQQRLMAHDDASRQLRSLLSRVRSPA